MKNLGTNIMQTMQDFYDKNYLKTTEEIKNTQKKFLNVKMQHFRDASLPIGPAT